jgi:hypothetical protein
MTAWEKNTKVIQKYWPGLYTTLEAVESIQIEPIETAEGITVKLNGMYLHSSRSPVREAEKLCDRVFQHKSSAIVFIGSGLGYQIHAFRKLHPHIPIVLAEPSRELFKAMLETIDFTPLLAQEGIHIMLEPSADGLVAYLQQIAHGTINWYTLPGIEKSYPDETFYLAQSLAAFQNKRKVNQNTLRKFGKRWIRNLTRNLHAFKQFRGIQGLKGILSDIPAIVFAAGPSLDALLPHLEALRNRFFFIAVDTALGYFSTASRILGKEIYPDIVVAVDPQYWNSRHIDNGIPQNSILIAESSCYPSVFRKNFKGFRLIPSLFPLGNFLMPHLAEQDKLGAGGSVSTTAWDLARHLGAPQIYFAGLDLGYPGGKTHFRGSTFEKLVQLGMHRMKSADSSVIALKTEAGNFHLKNNKGGQTRTDKRLSLYRDWFEEQCKKEQGRYFNLAEMGLFIEGMPLAQIEDLLVTSEKVSLIQKAASLIDPINSSANNDSIVERIEMLIHVLKKSSTIAQEALKQINEYEKGAISLQSLNQLLDQVDENLLKMEERTIVGFLIQPYVEEYSQEDDPIKQSYRIYSSLKESAEYQLNLLSKRYG